MFSLVFTHILFPPLWRGVSDECLSSGPPLWTDRQESNLSVRMWGSESQRKQQNFPPLSNNLSRQGKTHHTDASCWQVTMSSQTQTQQYEVHTRFTQAAIMPTITTTKCSSQVVPAIAQSKQKCPNLTYLHYNRRKEFSIRLGDWDSKCLPPDNL